MDQGNGANQEGTIVQNPQEQVPQQQGTTNPKQKKKLIVLIFIVVMILIPGIIFSIFLLRARSVQIEKTIIPLTTGIPVPSIITEDPTVNLLVTKSSFSQIPNTSYEVKLKEASALNESCIDCPTDTILIVKGIEILDRDVTFSCGGIASACMTNIPIEGVDIQIGQQVDEDSVYVIIRYPKE